MEITIEKIENQEITNLQCALSGKAILFGFGYYHIFDATIFDNEEIVNAFCNAKYGCDYKTLFNTHAVEDEDTGELEAGDDVYWTTAGDSQIIYDDILSDGVYFDKDGYEYLLIGK